MTEPATDTRARAADLRGAGWSYREIGAEMGMSQTAIYRWLNPAAVACRERARRAEKENWHRLNYRGECRRCGGDTSGRDHGMCDACRDIEKGETREFHLSIVEGMWADGWTLREMGEAFGHHSKGGVNQWINDLRRHGRAPLRRTPEQAARIRAARWGDGRAAAGIGAKP